MLDQVNSSPHTIGGANSSKWWWCLWGELCWSSTEFLCYSYYKMICREQKFLVSARTLINLILLAQYQNHQNKFIDHTATSCCSETTSVTNALALILAFQQATLDVKIGWDLEKMLKPNIQHIQTFGIHKKRQQYAQQICWIMLAKNGVICKCIQFARLAYHVSAVGCGASLLGGSQSNTSNPILGLCSGTFLLMTSDDNQTRPQHTTQTRNKHHHYCCGLQPLQWHLFDKSTPPKEWADNFLSMPLKDLIDSIK